MKLGDKVKLVVDAGVHGINKGAMATVVDGETVYPHYYQELCSKLSEPLVKEFIFVTWDRDKHYNGGLDGAYHGNRFELVESITYQRN